MRPLLALPLCALIGCVSAETPPGFVGGPPEPTEIGPFRWTVADAGIDFVSAFPDPMPLPEENNEDYVNGGGAAFLDFTGDGRPDLVATAPWSGPRVFVNDGQGSFSPAPNPALEAVPLSACAVGLHLDDDDARDLLLCADGKLSAWRNDGSAGFTWVMDVLDLGALQQRAESVAAADLDGDGRLELFVATQFVRTQLGWPGPAADRLLRHTGDFAFEEISELLPDATEGQSFAGAMLDVDDDGALDLLSLRDRGDILWPASAWLNPGDGGPWPEVAAERALAFAFDAMGSAHGDIDGDGTTELIVTDNHARLHLRSLVDGVAVDRGAELGLVVQSPELQASSWGPALFDADNDGDLDLMVPFGRVHMLVGDPAQQIGAWRWDDGELVEVTELLDQPASQIDESWRTVLPGDVDGDGTLEVLAASHVGPAVLFDPSPTANRWVRLRLRGPPGNLDGLGARVTLLDGTDRARWRDITIGGSGMASSAEPVAHFGLGEDPAPFSLGIRWPDGSTTDVEGVPNQELLARYPGM